MFLYRLLLVLSLPVIGIRMLFALAFGDETTQGLTERFGGGTGPVHGQETIWVHGASLGELMAAKALIDDILARHPNMQVLVTANTTTGRALVASWAKPRIIPHLAPLDNPLIINRFFRRWSPRALITLENEIWPMRTLLAKRRDIPVLVVSGRMSKNSASNWARLPGFAKQVMGAIDALFPLDAENGERFVRLGLPMGRLCQSINLKSAVVLGAPDPTELARLDQTYDRDKTILAASTHPGEEAQILAAFATLPKDLNARLILAPRHASRSAEVVALIKAANLPMKTRSDGQYPTPETQVYLADTTGEMALWYALSGVVLLGGSWVEKGGHSPFEPAQFGAVVIHGPDVSNHREAYDALHAAGACIRAENAADLIKILAETLTAGELTNTAALATTALSKLRNTDANSHAVLAKISELTTQN